MTSKSGGPLAALLYFKKIKKLMKKKNKIYSGQPRFFIPSNIFQLFKPRPPSMEIRKPKNQNSFEFNENPRNNQHFPTRLSFAIMVQKDIGQVYSRVSHLRKRVSEFDPILRILFKNFNLLFFQFRSPKILCFSRNPQVKKFLKKFSKRLISLHHLRKWINSHFGFFFSSKFLLGKPLSAFQLKFRLLLKYHNEL